MASVRELKKDIDFLVFEVIPIVLSFQIFIRFKSDELSTLFQMQLNSETTSLHE